MDYEDTIRSITASPRADVVIRALAAFKKINYNEWLLPLEVLLATSNNSTAASTLDELECFAVAHLEIIIDQHGIDLDDEHSSIAARCALVETICTLDNYQPPELIMELLDGDEDNLDTFLDILTLTTDIPYHTWCDLIMDVDTSLLDKLRELLEVDIDDDLEVVPIDQMILERCRTFRAIHPDTELLLQPGYDYTSVMSSTLDASDEEIVLFILASNVAEDGVMEALESIAAYLTLSGDNSINMQVALMDRLRKVYL